MVLLLIMLNWATMSPFDNGNTEQILVSTTELSSYRENASIRKFKPVQKNCCYPTEPNTPVQIATTCAYAGTGICIPEDCSEGLVQCGTSDQ